MCLFPARSTQQKVLETGFNCHQFPQIFLRVADLPRQGSHTIISENYPPVRSCKQNSRPFEEACLLQGASCDTGLLVLE